MPLAEIAKDHTAAASSVDLHRTMEAAFFNEVANHPQVRPFIGGGEHRIDLTEVIANPANFALRTAFGGFILAAQGGGGYETHSMFLPEGRGAYVVRAMHEAFRFMFTRTDCIEVLTRVPDGNGRARGLAQIAGFQQRFRREACWPTPDGMVGADFKAVGIDQWAFRDAACVAEGIDFHGLLEDEKKLAGSKLETHPVDEAHDQAVGAAILMAKAGNGLKGVAFYNRWARFAGYRDLQVLSAVPLVVDIHDAVITMHDGDLEVLACR
jgi:hypothetical protein